MKAICLCLGLAALGMTGCASVTSGTSQTVTVTPVCEGAVRAASCELLNNKGRWMLEAPGATVIQKSTADLAVTCRKEDSVGTAVFVSKSNSGVWGNILVGGLIGYAVDSASGAGFNYPQEMPVIMRSPCAASEPSPTKERKAS